MTIYVPLALPIPVSPCLSAATCANPMPTLWPLTHAPTRPMPVIPMPDARSPRENSGDRWGRLARGPGHDRAFR